ncbi:Tim12p CYBJADRAFT_167008 [Cyberlindnera jadinii NRRL Y-1542]|uniref:Mitochondrial import inner membrane translocase subunit n=1 Tax=Cyberlindnera jadinii (strain ATCC 18201 / CBS 1600 / BCRC 20928 / JCM 3617 / NBRC 0987 / NRRL Y-1542) TaxID=983966 RepID=A0A1E4S4E5_CYBJN|nr:hypothetical protein CYBJADRAFT_167008 [Cyberlindnera jadinii NRRL Y-1542]ODV74320.1 hypothetical protein CYBJADRAFT_167008 [Cyberlindnera jadinii NRRL Y-1542]
MSYLLGNMMNQMEADPEKVKFAEVQFDAMNTTFNTMLRTCQSKCIPDEYGEAELNKGETVCVDRCVKKFFKANLAMGRYVQAKGFVPANMRQYDRFTR